MLGDIRVNIVKYKYDQYDQSNPSKTFVINYLQKELINSSKENIHLVKSTIIFTLRNFPNNHPESDAGYSLETISSELYHELINQNNSFYKELLNLNTSDITDVIKYVDNYKIDQTSSKTPSTSSNQQPKVAHKPQREYFTTHVDDSSLNDSLNEDTDDEEDDPNSFAFPITADISYESNQHTRTNIDANSKSKYFQPVHGSKNLNNYQNDMDIKSDEDTDNNTHDNNPNKNQPSAPIHVTIPKESNNHNYKTAPLSNSQIDEQEKQSKEDPDSEDFVNRSKLPLGKATSLPIKGTRNQSNHATYPNIFSKIFNKSERHKAQRDKIQTQINQILPEYRLNVRAIISWLNQLQSQQGAVNWKAVLLHPNFEKLTFEVQDQIMDSHQLYVTLHQVDIDKMQQEINHAKSFTQEQVEQWLLLLEKYNCIIHITKKLSVRFLDLEPIIMSKNFNKYPQMLQNRILHIQAIYFLQNESKEAMAKQKSATEQNIFSFGADELVKIGRKYRQYLSDKGVCTKYHDFFRKMLFLSANKDYNPALAFGVYHPNSQKHNASFIGGSVIRPYIPPSFLAPLATEFATT